MDFDVDGPRPQRLLLSITFTGSIAMVVLFHAAETYPGFDSWYVFERISTRRSSVIGLAAYQSLKQAAMDLFFGIASYFASRSLVRFRRSLASCHQRTRPMMSKQILLRTA